MIEQTATTTEDDAAILLRALGVRKTFRQRGGPKVTAVSDVSFELQAGRTLALVGESGSGKSTVARMVVGLISPDEGAIEIDGISVAGATREQRQTLKRRVQMVFQDPGGSLNPALTIGRQIAEPLVVHEKMNWTEAVRRAGQWLDRCGLDASNASRHPHMLSGGQRQRAAIARAMVLEPACLVCDEPTSALDVATQARVLNLLRDLQDANDLALLLISHDMAVVDHMADEVAVMRRGRIVEHGPRNRVIDSPADSYTRKLLDAVPGKALSTI